MNGKSMRLALPTAILAIVLSAPGQADDTIKADFSPQELQEKIAYCMSCHGVSGQGFQVTTPFPRLAGQRPQYIENQLKAFFESRRENQYMSKIAHLLSPAMRIAIAKHFSGLNPKPLGGAPKENIAAGRKIYQEGLPDVQVPPCASCHGPEAKGDGQFPRLAGQLYEYTVNKLTNWSRERGRDPRRPDTSAIMKPIAHNLSNAQIAAVAAYLNYLE